MNQRITENKINTLSIELSEACLTAMVAFQFAVNRILINYGEDINLSENVKKIHAHTVLHEWPSARDQFHLGQLYNSKCGIHLEEKLWVNQQYNTLNIYKKLSGSRSPRETRHIFG